MRCSILLVTWNSWHHTEACISGLGTLPPDVEVIVADNGSSDGTPQRIRDTFPFVKLIETGGNLGFGSGCNRAAQAALGKWLLFLNNDTRPSLAWLHSMLSAIEELDGSTAPGSSPVLTCLARNPNGNLEPSLMQDNSRLGLLATACMSEVGARRILCATPSSDGKIHPVPWSSALCWMMPATLFRQSGGFDERIFLYYEDAELAWRLRRIGARFWVHSGLELQHDCGGSSSGSLSRSLAHDRSQRYYYGKRWGRGGVLTSVAFQVLRSGIRVALGLPAVLFGKSHSSLRLHWALLKGNITHFCQPSPFS